MWLGNGYFNGSVHAYADLVINLQTWTILRVILLEEIYFVVCYCDLIHVITISLLYHI